MGRLLRLQLMMVWAVSIQTSNIHSFFQLRFFCGWKCCCSNGFFIDGNGRIITVISGVSEHWLIDWLCDVYQMNDSKTSSVSSIEVSSNCYCSTHSRPTTRISFGFTHSTWYDRFVINVLTHQCRLDDCSLLSFLENHFRLNITVSIYKS